MIYKILAKVLAQWLASFLSNIIYVSETRLTRSGCIFDNMLLLWESMALADHYSVVRHREDLRQGTLATLGKRCCVFRTLREKSMEYPIK